MADDMFPKRADGHEGRVFTNVPVGFLFVLTFAGMVALAVVGFIEGDTKRLTHGRDFQGNLCGVDEATKDMPYQYYCGFVDRKGDYPTHLNYGATACVASCPNSSTEQIACVMPEYVNTTLMGRDVQERQGLVFDETFDVQITQSVAYQKSYPTEKHLGRYCVPKQTSENDLYSRVVNGPLKEVSQFNDVVESFKRAWPVILGVVLFAILLGVAFLYTLKKFAGLLLYSTLWIGCVFAAIFGLFFLCGLFFDPYNELGTYQTMSPIFVLCSGPAARMVSALTGLILLAASVCLFFSAWNERIDESIGLIDAACDCILGDGSHLAFVIQPVTQALVGSVLLIAVFLGYLFIASVTTVNRRLISINYYFPRKETFAPQPLMGRVERAWYWEFALHFYAIGAVWLLITFLTYCQFVISYAVCDWFFSEAEQVDNPAFTEMNAAMGNVSSGKAKRLHGLRLKGVDKVQGARSGFLTRVGGNQVVCMPVGERIRMSEKITQKSLHWCAMAKGVTEGIIYHTGTLAIAGVVGTVTFPFRIFSEIFKTFTDAAGEGDDSDGTYTGLLVGGLGLLSTFLDEFFGRFGKNLLTDVVLRSSDFSQASNDSMDFIIDAGGAVALLHGATGNYEVVGIVVITSMCTILAYALITKLYGDPDSDNYVPSPGMITLLCAGLSWMIAAGFMGLINIAADGLLYAFVYARANQREALEDCMPTRMNYLLSNEIESVPALALQAQPRNRLSRFSHAASKYGDNFLSTIRGAGSEGRPLLPVGTNQ